MMINRSYLQRSLKNNPLIQFIFIAYIFIITKYFEKNKDKWLDFQKERLVKILCYAQKHSQYYNRILAKRVITNKNAIKLLQSLPLLDKQIIQRIGREIYSDEITEHWKLWLNTGGSTGNPLKFPALYYGLPLEAICQMMLYRKMGYKLGDVIVSVGGNRVSETDLNNNIYWETGGNFPYGKVKFSTLYLNISTIRYYWDKLNTTKPQYIRGYPSGITDLCKLAQEKQLPMKFQLKGVYLSSENFTQADKEFIGNFFHCPVYGQYGHTESSVFAIQNCKENFYLCNPIYGYTEILNSSGNHVKIGETGEIVVTGFVEYGLPFIRYKTGDLAIYGGKTEYGETIIKELLGRSADYIINNNNKKIYLVGFIFGGHLKAFNYIEAWQIRQSQVGRIELYIVRGKGYSDNIEKELIELFTNNNFTVNVKYVNAIEKTPRGKQKFLIQEIKL